MMGKIGGGGAGRLPVAYAAAALVLLGAVRAEARAQIVLGIGPPVMARFPSPIYIPAPLPYTPAPGAVVRPPAPLPPLVLKVQPPVAFPVAPRNENARQKRRR